MNRRNLLATGPAAMVLVGAGIGTAVTAHAHQPDAGLIALCAEYVRTAREFCSVGSHTWDMDCSNPEWIRCNDLASDMVPGMHALEAQITGTPAHTLLGIQAKAEVARHQLSGDADRDTGPMDPDNALVWSLLTETLAVLGRA